MGNFVAGCYIVCRKGETIMNGNGDITLNGYAIIPLEQYSEFCHWSNAHQMAVDRGLLPSPTNEKGDVS